jgi:signal transduction histidine kinase
LETVPIMRLADFILSNSEPILAEWEVFARSIGAGEHLDQLALRDHAGQILHATARDMNVARTASERAGRSKGAKPAGTDSDALDGASDMHAVDRLSLGFDMLEVMSEYRALRASVLRLWHESGPGPDERDVHDLTRFNESVDQSLAKAVASYTQRVDQARDMFLAILSHDLRNPLNSIAMTAQMVPHLANDPAEALECSQQLTRSVSVMERMISDLLDYTRTRLGAGMPVNPAPTDLAVLGRELFDEYRASFPGRDIQFRADGDLHGLWDHDRVRQAVSNLLGNAIQHGSVDFPVVLSFRGRPSDVIVEVQNGGPPILPAELPRIFDPLVRGTNAANPKKNRPGSIGMGLYIAREVAKSHGGRIDVTSTVADGTSFTMRLPRESAPKVGQPILDTEHIRTM